MFFNVPLVVLIAVVVVAIGWTGRILVRKLKRLPCTRCGAASAHGYSKHAESPADEIVRLFESCLLVQLKQDYADFRGRAVVVQPVPDLPCYVFRDTAFLESIPGDQELKRDVAEVINQGGVCGECGAVASIWWIESRGLNRQTFEQVFDRGLRQSLFKWGNPQPHRLCSNCLPKRIAKSFGSGHFSYLEICSPRAKQEGIV